jgi:hypothetical protein
VHLPWDYLSQLVFCHRSMVSCSDLLILRGDSVRDVLARLRESTSHALTVENVVAVEHCPCFPSTNLQHGRFVHARVKQIDCTRHPAVMDPGTTVAESLALLFVVSPETGPALDLVDMHLHEENPDHIDECIKLYSDDAVWEAPARGVAYAGRERIKEMYLRIFSSADSISFHPVERFATPDRVFDDMWVKFHLTGPGFENCPLPIGTKNKGAFAAQFSHSGWVDRPGNWLRDLAPR